MVVKKASVPKKPAAPKKTAPRTKKAAPPVSVDSALDDSDASDYGEEDDKPAPVWGADVEEIASKTIEETYQKKSQLEHILLRPDTYIGSVEPNTQSYWVYDTKLTALQYRKVKITPGLYKIFDEILVNAADNKIRDKTMDTIKVVIDQENCFVSVMNNGKGIPIEIHKNEKIYVPELIFGHLLTSSNYDDSQKKVTGGRNGYGAKLCNIFSKEFIVETADKVSGRKFKQVFRDNMSNRSAPVVSNNSKKEEYTKITFRPDLAKFHMETLDDDIVSLMTKRVYDIAGTLQEVKVFLNGERIKIRGFKQYVEMYLNAPAIARRALAAKQKPLSLMNEGADGETPADPDIEAIPKPVYIYETPSPRWEIAFAVSDGQFQQVSFVNSICTTKGGTHVSHIADQIAARLVEAVKKKVKSTITPGVVKNHMWIFVNCLIENPTFDSQTKETLTLRQSAFGSKCEPSERFFKWILKSEIVLNSTASAQLKLERELKKSDGGRTQRLMGIEKLEDATCAGTREAGKCTLVLTEGDSARSLALCGFEVVGKKYFGVFPLRGKMLNVRGATHNQLLGNKELNNIKRILGLKHGQTNDISKLRYGHIMIMTDQDHDGSHIKGLIINFFDHFYPELLKKPGFLLEFITPIVRATRGKDRKIFYTLPEYEKWVEEQGDSIRSWTSKYFKGLGTSDAQDAKRYFAALDTHRKQFSGCESEDRKLLDMVFNSSRADERKEWLRQFQQGTYLDHNQATIRISDFINRELILFSMADNIRSIPSMVDGFKPGQRKVLFSCIKRNIKKEVRVSQLAAQVASDTHYHHGEDSLSGTIVNMAQDFVGSNNLNILSPNGQFGTRFSGGDDSASPRYLNTLLLPITRKIYCPQDDHLLTYLKEDNDLIEPECYVPIVPLVLMNNATGIGTGWSTNIPSYNPVDIVNNIRRIMNGQEMVPMVPWYRGYRGTIRPDGPGRYSCTGIINQIDDTTLEITELPIKVWNESYKQLIESWCVGTDKVTPFIKDYVNYSGVYTVRFVITLTPEEMANALAEGLETKFRLITRIATTNMICFDRNHRIKKYEAPEEIIHEFYDLRLQFYQKRKEWMIDQLTQDYVRLDNRVRFILEIIENKLVVQNRKKADLVAELQARKYTPLAKINKGTSASLQSKPGIDANDENGKDGDDESTTLTPAAGYDYLLTMPIWNLTREKVEEMVKNRDSKQAEIDILLKTSPIELWNVDLDVFLEAWQQKLEYHDRLEQETIQARADHEQGTSGKKAKPKAKPRAKAVKVKVADDDGVEPNDLAPAKTAAVHKPAVKVKTEITDEPGVSFANVSASGASPASSTGAKPAPKARGKGKAAATTAGKMDDNQKLDGFLVAKPKAKPQVVADDDDSDDSDEDDLSLSLTARMNKLLASRKRKLVDSDDEDFANPISTSLATKPPPPRVSPAKRASKEVAPVVSMDNSPSSVSDALAPKAKRRVTKKARASPGDTPKASPAKAARVTAGRAKAKPTVIDSPTSSAQDDSPMPARRRPARSARATRQPAKYVEISDSDDDKPGDHSASEADFDEGDESDF
ncbi:DNA topoisomerase [Dimargaris cristalligena]|uniref:DNA topoisomerase 2 n=1 Tax=Dimargaris cristalligena TaxID=215637 RepID=A0A4Q0A0N6_9FUNG|nr:DNA topoisomerase [Dimargaris cristalligena]|eukprot:RKP39288.1 DNA topoisomerase [Dimargaris cristalligena]